MFSKLFPITKNTPFLQIEAEKKLKEYLAQTNNEKLTNTKLEQEKIDIVLDATAASSPFIRLFAPARFSLKEKKALKPVLNQINENINKAKKLWANNLTRVNEQIVSCVEEDKEIRSSIRDPSGYLRKQAGIPKELLEVVLAYNSERFRI